jgi:penicillin-binding protein 2
MNNPKIAIAVIVENGGFGSTWAGPMAYLMIEKYLTDSLRADRKIEADRIGNTNLLPSWLPREQFRTDSIRAFQWFKITNDSNYIKKYIRRGSSVHVDKPKTDTIKPRNNRTLPPLPRQPVENDSVKQLMGYLPRMYFIDPKKQWHYKKKGVIS